MDAAHKLRYTILDDGNAIRCHRCDRVSHNIDDVRARYCGNCQRFHDDAELPLPANLRAIADSIAMIARQDIGQGREVPPGIFIMRTSDGGMWSPKMAMTEPDERELMAQETRLLADEHDADVVILLSEAWARETRSLAEMAEMRAKYGNSIAAMPDRQDILLLSVETPEHYWSGRAPISGAGPDRRCGELVYELADTELGRFTHFLSTPAEKLRRAEVLAQVEAAMRAKGHDPQQLTRYDGAQRPLIDVLRRVMVRHQAGEYHPGRLDELVATLLRAR